MEKLDCTLCILCGGLGTRIKEISGGASKSMLNISGKPLLHRVIVQSGGRDIFKHTLLLAGHKSEGIIDFIANNNVMQSQCEVIVEERPLGTGGAVINALKKIKTQDFIVINGDTLTDFNIPQLIVKARRLSASCVIGGITVKNVADYGALEVKKDGTLVQIHEKSRSGPGIANCGIVYFKKSVIQKISLASYEGNTLSLEKDILGSLKKTIHVFTDKKTQFLDVGTPERVLKANEKFYES